MRKTVLAVALVVAGLTFNPISVRAEQYDNLVKLPLDENQAAVMAELVESETEGDVLGVKTVMEEPEMAEVGPHFFYGEEQVLDDDLVGDVYVIAGKVDITGNIDGDLMVLGGTVMMSGNVSQDVRAGAGTIYVNGSIGQNLTIGAGQVYFGEKAKVGNSVVVGGGEINLNGQTAGKVLLGGGAAKLAGQYGSDVHAQADTFKVLPGVVINGSLIADAYTSADVSPDVQVVKEKMVQVVPAEEKQRPMAENRRMKPVGGVLVKATLLEFLVQLLIGLVSGSLLIYFLPRLVKQVKNQILAAPMANFGWGFAYIFLTPLVILFALVSLVAMPIAGLIGLVFLGSMIVAKTLVAVALGEKLSTKIHAKALKNPYLSFALGLTVLKLVSFLPILGWFVSFVAFTVGMGALFALMRNYLMTRNK